MIRSVPMASYMGLSMPNRSLNVGATSGTTLSSLFIFAFTLVSISVGGYDKPTSPATTESAHLWLLPDDPELGTCSMTAWCVFRGEEVHMEVIPCIQESSRLTLWGVFVPS